MDYKTHVAARMKRGAEEYGQRSWSRPLVELIEEMMEECADIGGWGKIAQSRATTEGDYDKIKYAIACAEVAHYVLGEMHKQLGG